MMTGLDGLAKEVGIEARCIGLPPMPFLEFFSKDALENQALKDVFYRETVGRGIFFAPNHLWYIMFSHKAEDIDQTLDAARQAFRTAREKSCSPAVRRAAQSRLGLDRFPSKKEDRSRR